MNLTVLAYTLYLAISILLTVWVAHTLHRNGRIFLLQAFKGNGPLCDSVNHLLLVGFYLVNLGFVALHLKLTGVVGEVREVFEVMGSKLGIVFLVLGGMHFFNLYLFHRLLRKEEEGAAPPLEPYTTLQQILNPGLPEAKQ